MSHNKLNISIVVYQHDISEIEPLLVTLAQTPFAVTILDNSPNNTLEKQLSSYKHIRYIFNNNNLGYGRAHNISIQQSIGLYEYHLVLNPDIEFNTAALDEMIAFMDKNKDVGLSMPNIFYPNGKRQHLTKLLPTPWNLFARRFGLCKRFNKRSNDRFELKGADFSVPFSAPYLSGCFMFMRTSVLQQTGGFDERFFMYCEDIDLSRRINTISKTMFIPTEPVIHRHSKASYKLSKMVLFHIHSAVQYFNKWGWLFDRERKKVNKKTLDELNLL